MTRKEFLDIGIEHVRQGRRAYFPEMSRGEEAAGLVSTRALLLKIWRRERDHFANMLPGVYAERLRKHDELKELQRPEAAQ